MKQWITTRLLPTSYRLLLAVVMVGLLQSTFCPPVAAVELTQGDQKARDRLVVRLVLKLLNEQHLLQRGMDDEISQRALKSYLQSLDPLKLYFYQADIDEFDGYRNQIDDTLRRGDIHFAYDIFNRFLQRMEERVTWIPELLTMDHDFSLQEKLVTDPDEAKYAENPSQARDLWRRRIKYDLLSLKQDEVVGEEAVKRLTRRYNSFARRMEQYKPDDILEIYLTSVCTSYDPHTTYMSPSTLENFEISMRLNLDGIGAALSMVDGYTEVQRIIAGGAASRQGELKEEDRIVSVGQGEDGEMVEVIDMRLNDVVQLIRGKAGSVVRLGVKEGGLGETKIVRIVRDRIELKDSEARGGIIEAPQMPGGLKANGKPFRTGVIKLPSFYMDMAAARKGAADFKSTTSDVRRILEDFRRQGVDSVVLDLRYNGGGSLPEAIQLTGLFFKSGPVVQVKGQDGRVQTYEDPDNGVVWDGPLVVVINKFSASASEILAGAIQDYQRGLVIGDEATHGKGTVQSLLDLSQRMFPNIPNAPNLGALKITMQQFYRPDGASTQKRGVVSDVILPSTTNEMDISESDLDYAIKFDTVPVAPHQDYGQTKAEVIEQLRSRLAERIASSEDFQKEINRIQKYVEQKELNSVSLNEQEFMARREELNAEKEDEEQFEEVQNTEDKVFDLEDFYDREILNITLDYVRSLNQVSLAAGS